MNLEQKIEEKLKKKGRKTRTDRQKRFTFRGAPLLKTFQMWTKFLLHYICHKLDDVFFYRWPLGEKRIF